MAVAGAAREVKQIAREALDKIALKGAELLGLNQVPVCARCWCRFAEFQVRLPLWRRYRLFGCRSCQAGHPRLEGVQRLVLVLD